MSLNGLDSPSVVEAYQSTIADPGGWLLLHYVSRDELAVSQQGNGGWAELRATLDANQEPSPLYGFFLYRRRKILLQYIPDGTSRLLKVRTTVHFQAITAHFSPHDATFSATAPGDITESALSATCSLHTEAPLGSSDGSLRRRNLDEITEDAEEPQSSNPQVSSILARLKANKLSQERNNAAAEAATWNGPAESERSVDYNARARPPADEFTLLPTADDTPASPTAASPSTARGDLMDRSAREELMESLTSLSITREVREARRRERQPVANQARAESPHLYPRKPRTPKTKKLETMRPEFYESRQDIHELSRPGTSDSKYSFLTWKPKKKLAPRPAEADSVNRPATENSTRQRLPAGMRIGFHRGESAPKLPRAERVPSVPKIPKSPKSPKSKRAQYAANPSSNFDSTNILAGTTEFPKSEPIFEKKPDVAARSVPVEQEMPTVNHVAALAPKSSESSMKKAAVAPEKQRLMKALQQRNKQMTKAVTETKDDSAKNLPDLDVSTQKIAAEDAAKADSGVDFEGAENNGIGIRIDNAPVSTEPSNSVVHDSEAQDRDVPAEPKSKYLAVGDSTADFGSESAISQTKAAIDRIKKRRANLQPLQTSPALTNDSEGFEYDESLMEELQNATVEEAKRVSLHGTDVDSAPLSPIYSHGNKKSITSVKSIVYQGGSVQSVQGPNGEQIPPGQRQATSPQVTVEQIAPAKRINVSTGISRRIKALAELSGRDNSHQTHYGRLDTPPSLHGSRASPIPSQGSPSLERPSFSRQSTSQSGPRSTPGGTSMQHPGGVDMGSQSVSITARIVHAGRNSSPERQPSRGGQQPMELQQSEVTIQHDPNAHNRSNSKTSFHRIDRPPSLSSRPESRESSFSTRTKQSMDHGFNFLGLRKSTDSKPATRSRRSPSIATLETVDEDTEEKRKSKKASIFKRMSGFGGGTPRKAPAASGSATSSGEGSSSRLQSPNTTQQRNAGCIVGDLNVQFPDTLLWKRRWVEVEPSGFLTLSSTNASERLRTTPRKYHMAEVRAPVIASQDGQELPFSILIDLINGGTLQLACEDAISQSQVLRRLADTHHAWTQ